MTVSKTHRPPDDFWWDTAQADERMAHAITAQAIPTALFAKQTVPFYRQHYRHLSVADIQRIRCAGEFVDAIPPLTKEHLAHSHPDAFIPEGIAREKDPNRGEFFRFGTGGTTSKPVQISHSMSDWRAMAATARRSVEFDFLHDPAYTRQFPPDLNASTRTTPLSGERIVGSYHGDHITNGVFASFLTTLGAEFHFRPSTTPSIEDICDQLNTIKASGILAPPESGSTRKGICLRDILDVSARLPGKRWRLNHQINPGFRFVFWSSTPISESLYRRLADDLRIPYIKGHFGSTEVAPTSSTCSAHPRQFHLDFGHSLVLVKNINGNGIAGANELGHTLVSKTAGLATDGSSCMPSGSMLINFMTGDAARLTPDGVRCACGRTTAVLYDTHRVEFQQGKALFGCQVN